jgi:DNA-binding NarL/FixJ family response regulator
MKGFVNLPQQANDQSADILTDREREILQLITEGMTNQDMADLLCISTSTVDSHRKNLMSKLDVHSVVGLVKYAIKHKVVKSSLSGFKLVRFTYNPVPFF